MADISISRGSAAGRENGQRSGRWLGRLRRRLRARRRLARVRTIRRRRRLGWILALDDERLLRDIGVDPAPAHAYDWLIELTRR